MLMVFFTLSCFARTELPGILILPEVSRPCPNTMVSLPPPVYGVKTPWTKNLPGRSVAPFALPVKTVTVARPANRSMRSELTNIMTKLEIKGDWNITKGKLKQRWAKLTDDDLQYAEGKQEELLGRIQKRTGETREAVEKAVREVCSSCCS